MKQTTCLHFLWRWRMPLYAASPSQYGLLACWVWYEQTLVAVCIERYCAVCRPFQRWRIKHVIIFVNAAAVYSGGNSAIAFPTGVFDSTTAHFCERRASLARSVMDALNTTSWFAVVTIMTVLYMINIVNICKRSQRMKKNQNSSAVRDFGWIYRQKLFDIHQ